MQKLGIEMPINIKVSFRAIWIILLELKLTTNWCNSSSIGPIPRATALGRPYVSNE